MVRNEEIYRRTESQPLTIHITKARWALFGHILRRPEDIPANAAMKAYFEPSNKPSYRGKPPINLPTLINEDLNILSKNTQTHSHFLDHCYHRQLQLKNEKDLNDSEKLPRIETNGT